MFSQHRRQIDDHIGLARQEHSLLTDVEKPSPDLEKYALALDKILLQKLRETAQLRDKLHQFYKDVKTEAVMTEM